MLDGGRTPDGCWLFPGTRPSECLRTSSNKHVGHDAALCGVKSRSVDARWNSSLA